MKYNFTPETCWYKDVCDSSGSEHCTVYCIKFGQMKHMIENSNLPKTLCYPIKLTPQMIDIEAFRTLNSIGTNIVNFVQHGSNLYIFSNVPGNGKTTWSAKLMLKYFHNIWENNCYNERGLFISTTDFLLNVRLFGYKDNTIQTLFNKIKTLDLVIWDDIGVGQLTGQDLDLLYSLINYRVQNGLSNIFTGNLGGEQLFEILGERLFSRVWNDSIIVELMGDDRRGQR